MREALDGVPEVAHLGRVGVDSLVYSVGAQHIEVDLGRAAYATPQLLPRKHWRATGERERGIKGGKERADQALGSVQRAPAGSQEGREKRWMEAKETKGQRSGYEQRRE